MELQLPFYELQQSAFDKYLRTNRVLLIILTVVADQQLQQLQQLQPYGVFYVTLFTLAIWLKVIYSRSCWLG